MSKPTPNQRLLQLRERIGLSQRQLAAEFNVTPGAIANWEKGSTVPGPILKLVELYESYLGTELDPPAKDEIRRISSDWTQRILKAIKPRQSERNAIRRKLETQIDEVLMRNLPKESWKRSIQLSIAERIVDSISESKGIPMKIAQLASYLDLSLPPEIRETLATLQHLSAPMAPTVAARVFYEETGKAPNQVFAEWEPRPFAAASIGQVHRAKLKTGEIAAVKIQYPGIRESLEKDFSRIGTLQRIAALIKTSDPQIIAELKRHVIAECDYEREASIQERMEAYFKGHPTIIIPKVHASPRSPRIMTQELIQGRTYLEFARTAPREAKQRAAKALMDFYSHGFFLSGILHTDPHPGNYLILEDGRVAVLDFGRTFELDPSDSRNFRDIYLAIIADDKAAGRRVLERMQVVRSWDRFDFDAFWDLSRAVHEEHLHGGEFEMTPEFFRSSIERMQRFPQKDELRSPPGFFWSNTTHLGTWYLLSHLNPTFDWRKEALALIKRMPEDGFLSRWDD